MHVHSILFVVFSLSFQLTACGPGHLCSDFEVPGETGVYPQDDYYEDAHAREEGWGYTSRRSCDAVFDFFSFGSSPWEQFYIFKSTVDRLVQTT